MTDPDAPPSVASTNAAAHNPYYPHEDAAERDAARARRDRRHQPVDLDAVVKQLLDEHQERREHKQQHR